MKSQFDQSIAEINDLLCSINLLQWDSRVVMPKHGHTTRGQQIATLQKIARQRLLAPELQAMASEMVQEPQADGLQVKAARSVLEAIDFHQRIPEQLLLKQSAQITLSNQAWIQAREQSDFSVFRPHLERNVEIAREIASNFDCEHPYDPMVAIYEPGETANSLTQLFGSLREGMLPILEQKLSQPAPRTDFLYRDYPVEQQQAFSHELTQLLNYDLERGRLDTAVHPFEISFTREDVRITSRWSKNFLPAGLFGTMHETGHALYEMGVKPEYTRSAFATDMVGLYAVGGTSFGMHESQSRLFENHVGRSRAFWNNHYHRLQSRFPDQLGDVSVNEFVAAINHSKPSFIRVEADELTYDLHIMLRARIEMSLMDGSIEVADLPQIWNEYIKSDLGLDVPEDRLGVLQDIHWSIGYIGSFPTYTIGNITAAQVMDKVKHTQPGIVGDLERGEVTSLQSYLTNHIWQHGRSASRRELLSAMDINPDDTTPYLNYLKGKFN